jgi:hypothetical protein
MGVVFGSTCTDARQTLVACVSDAKLWQLRLPRKDRATLDVVWIGVFFFQQLCNESYGLFLFLPENNDHLFEDVYCNCLRLFSVALISYPYFSHATL